MGETLSFSHTRNRRFFCLFIFDYCIEWSLWFLPSTRCRTSIFLAHGFHSRIPFLILSICRYVAELYRIHPSLSYLYHTYISLIHECHSQTSSPSLLSSPPICTNNYQNGDCHKPVPSHPHCTGDRFMLLEGIIRVTKGMRCEPPPSLASSFPFLSSLLSPVHSILGQPATSTLT